MTSKNQAFVITGVGGLVLLLLGLAWEPLLWPGMTLMLINAFSRPERGS
jgi:hypothetical protein